MVKYNAYIDGYTDVMLRLGECIHCDYGVAQVVSKWGVMSTAHTKLISDKA